MKTIVFENSLNETFNIMAEDERYIICSRIYSIQEQMDKQKEYDKNFNEYMSSCYKEYNEYEPNKYEDENDYLDNSPNADKCREEYIYNNGEQPEIYSEDLQCYTIVDKQEKIRGADNYYNKFNYLDKKECRKALKELNNGKLEISRRNKIHLSKYLIK